MYSTQITSAEDVRSQSTKTSTTRMNPTKRIAWGFSLLLLLAFAAGCSRDNRQSATYADGAARPNSFWWPNIVDLSPLRQHSAEGNPYGRDFD
jgi:hypothetical protein